MTDHWYCNFFFLEAFLIFKGGWLAFAFVSLISAESNINDPDDSNLTQVPGNIIYLLSTYLHAHPISDLLVTIS